MYIYITASPSSCKMTFELITFNHLRYQTLNFKIFNCPKLLPKHGQNMTKNGHNMAKTWPAHG